MKTLTLDIIKKNRVYFKCLSNGYEVKLLIDSNSEGLELGKQELLVDDISVRTKYGTDVIYKLSRSAEEQEEVKDKIVTLKSPYNAHLVESCKQLGGRWDSESKAWVFSSIVENEVEELEEIYNSELITIEITASDDCYAGKDSLKFCGYTIAIAHGRDSGATLADGISCIHGRVKSGGSMKNWATCASDGAIFRMRVPKLALEKFKDKEINTTSPNWVHVKEIV